VGGSHSAELIIGLKRLNDSLTASDDPALGDSLRSIDLEETWLPERETPALDSRSLWECCLGVAILSDIFPHCEPLALASDLCGVSPSRGSLVLAVLLRRTGRLADEVRWATCSSAHVELFGFVWGI
jgi:hypothetical protein